MNIFDELPFRVILDYAHNPHGMQAVADTVEEMKVAGRRMAVISAPGDRRDEDIREVGAIAGRAFDRIFLREDRDRRSREPGEIPRLLAEGINSAGKAEAVIGDDLSEAAVVGRALEEAQPGDLLLVCGDDLFAVWAQITGFGTGGRQQPTFAVVPVFQPPEKQDPVENRPARHRRPSHQRGDD